MSMTRRDFLTSLGGTGLFFAFRFTSEAKPEPEVYESMEWELDGAPCRFMDMDIDYREWIAFSPDGKVKVFTGRTEVGQGLKTVITALVTQALAINARDLTVVQGDTDRCPDDGPTVGSSATQTVGWGFWLACEMIRSQLMQRAARYLRTSSDRLEFRSGGVGMKGEKGTLWHPGEMGNGDLVVLDVDPKSASSSSEYQDLKIPNVNAIAIVTGSMKYTGDLKVPGMRYACCFTQPYHTRLTRISSLDATDALQVPGIEWAGAAGGRVVVVGQRYTQVQKALGRLRTLWSAPNRPKALPLEDARNGELTEVKEQAGDVDAAFASSHMVISETYKTQYIAHAPIETDTAVAHPPDDDGKITIYTHSQNPFLARQMVSDYMKLSPEQVCIVTIPAGGAFGGKNGNAVSREAAAAANAANVPVKMVYSRKNQFQLVSMFKPAAILDLTTGVNADGKIVARKLDFYQDVADGSRRTYDIPNVLTRAYRVGDWPFGSAATRGTSFVQTCFAIESHMHMIARKLDMDPLEFRRKNVKFPAFVQLIDACAGMLDYDNFQLEEDEGMGFGITNHGNDQLGVVGARVHVNRADGKVTVRHICAAFDIGTIINHRTCTVGIRGGITWGIGFALSEAITLDGHRSYTTHLSQYGIPRFSDIPQIDVSYHDNHKPGAPRGCGELPVIPTIGAIVNAVYEATGLRFYQTPITPERILSGL